MAWSGASVADFNITDVKADRVSQHLKQRKTAAVAISNSSVITGSQTLESLKPGTPADVIGIIISKECPRSIFSRKTPGKERHVLSCVLRDSPTCFVYVTCWGSEHHIIDISRNFIVGDVVKITKAQVHPKATDGTDEKFRPWTPLSVELSLSETHSTVSHYNGPDKIHYSSLLHIPTKSSSDYYTLEDIQANGQTLSGEHLNLLAALRKVGEVKSIKTKTGKQTKRCEVKLFDETCQSFPLILWGEEFGDLSQSWVPMETVLFAADARINYDDFRSAMVATADSKTIFTVNPDTMQARFLYQFAQTQDFADEDFYQTRQQTDPPLSEIKKVQTVKDIVSQIHGKSPDYCILYGIVTRFDLDLDDTDHFFRRRCSRCKQMVTVENSYHCSNTDCTLSTMPMFGSTGEITVGKPELEFVIPVSVTDQTGTVSQCRIYSSVIEDMTGLKVSDMMKLEPEKRTEIKWKFLLERCKLYVKIQRNMKDKEQLSLRVLSCCLADPADVPTIFNKK